MTLDELKVRLDLTGKDNEQDVKLKLLLDDAIDFVKRACNQNFSDETGALKLPGPAKMAVTMLVDGELNHSNGVTSESIGGMSQSFETSSDRHKKVIDTLRSAGLIRFGFVRACRQVISNG